MSRVPTATGSSGVLVMLGPGGDLWTLALPLPMTGFVTMAITRILARRLSLTETPDCQAFWLMVSHATAGVLLLGLFPLGLIGGWEVWAAGLYNLHRERVRRAEEARNG